MGQGLDVAQMRAHLHNVVGLLCSDGAILYGCHRCHRYTSHGHGKRITDEFCSFRRTHARNQAWRQICHGLHPLFPEVRVENVDLLRWPDEETSQLRSAFTQAADALRGSVSPA